MSTKSVFLFKLRFGGGGGCSPAFPPLLGCTNVCVYVCVCVCRYVCMCIYVYDNILNKFLENLPNLLNLNWTTDTRTHTLTYIHTHRDVVRQEDRLSHKPSSLCKEEGRLKYTPSYQCPAETVTTLTAVANGVASWIGRVGEFYDIYLFV
jgi:hypothetical protein